MGGVLYALLIYGALDVLVRARGARSGRAADRDAGLILYR